MEDVITINATKNITFAFISMIGHQPNKLTVVIIGHFLIENLINKIIFTKCKKSNVGSTFSAKLELINSMGLLPNDLYFNIKSLNKIRNKIVHTLNIELRNEFFYKTADKVITLNVKKYRDQEKAFLKLLTNLILIDLSNHMFFALRVSPDYNFFNHALEY